VLAYCAPGLPSPTMIFIDRATAAAFS
jgi:hypothetical protein